MADIPALEEPTGQKEDSGIPGPDRADGQIGAPVDNGAPGALGPSGSPGPTGPVGTPEQPGNSSTSASGGPQGDQGCDRIVLNDSIHGSIEIDSRLMKIIDTPEFQRLRRIKQLGGVCYVYPGAMHTRFEHSIGVCYIAGELVEKLKRDHPHLIHPRDVVCVQIAALCHDLGHGPFSHSYDTFLERVFEKDKLKDDLLQHEYRSVKLLEMLMDKHKLWETFGLKKSNDFNFLKALITFDKKCKARAVGEKELLQDWKPEDMGTERENVFLFEIVANGFTGIDVDKMDYFSRDSHGCGLHNTFGWRRYIQSTRLVPCEMDGCSKPVYRICTRDKDEHNLCELFHVRYVLYRAVYQHKTTIIIQHMIEEALFEAKESVMFQRTPDDYVGIHECALYMDAFIELTDGIQDLIMLRPYGSTNSEGHTDLEENNPPIVKIECTPGLLKAKKILDNVQKRKFPKCIGRKIWREKSSKDKIKSHFEQEAIKKFGATVAEKLIILPQTFASKERVEIRKHFFYRKYHGKEDNGFQLTEEEVSDLLPKSSVQSEVFAYYNFDDDMDANDTMKKLKEWFKGDIPPIQAT